MGFLVDEDAAAIWRGPMISSAIQQLLYKVAWGALDVLVVDLPPGTGDAQLSLIQHVPLAGAVVVSTPQPMALADVVRAVSMFAKVDARVLGVVENMSCFECAQCGHVSHVFGHGGAAAIAAERRTVARGATSVHRARAELPLLAEIPLREDLRQMCGTRQPVAVDALTRAVGRRRHASVRGTARQCDRRRVSKAGERGV